MKLMRKGLYAGSLIGMSFLAGGAACAQTQAETSLWQSVKDSKDSEDYAAYLDKYPEGVYSPLAKRRIASLKRLAESSAMSLPTAEKPQPAMPEVATAGAKSNPDAKYIPTDQQVNDDVDTGFSRWSAGWMFDRYVAKSARATERGMKDGTYVIRGMFDFVRSGSKLTIPFAASYTKTNDGYSLSNLCYNDSSSGMTDCINPNSSADLQRAGIQSQKFLGSIVALGMVAAMSTEETCVKRYTLFGEAYLMCD